MTRGIHSLAKLAEHYDYFLLDQFGVLLNGEGAYPFAPKALNTLSALGKKIVILSNSGKRSEANCQRLVDKGFVRDSFITVLSSGEVARQCLEKQLQADTRLLTIIREGDVSPVSDLPFTVVENPHDAELVLLCSLTRDDLPLGHYQRLLQDPCDRCIPLVCANPDQLMLSTKGARFAPGKVARVYQEAGGHVEWIGKPYPAIYHSAYELMGKPDKSKVLCIGDSPEHDICGGQSAGFTTALVRTGIHQQMSDEEVLGVCNQLGVVPDFILPEFSF